MIVRTPGVIAALMAGATACHAQHHLCTHDEAVLFTCALKAKTLSLCASQVLTPSEGYVQYRFGTPSKLELAYPPRQMHPRDQFRVQTWRGAGLDETSIVGFVNGGYSYRLHYTYVSVRPGADGDAPEGYGASAELRISKQGAVVRSELCSGATPLAWPRFLTLESASPLP